MTNLLAIVIYMVLVSWGALMLASALRYKEWTASGIRLAMGNRDNPPATTALGERADRAARNTVENFVLFAPVALVAHVAGVQSPNIILGAQIFLCARLAYLPVYYIGIPYLRTGVWSVSIAGLAMMVLALI